jgi:hypothetical protein
VAVFAPVLYDIEGGNQVLEAVNEINTSIRFARASWADNAITLETEVPSSPFVADQLLEACRAVGQLADYYAEKLQDRFGGRIANGPALPSRREGNAGYL